MSLASMEQSRATLENVVVADLFRNSPYFM
jgi:hypothetical protein